MRIIALTWEEALESVHAWCSPMRVDTSHSHTSSTCCSGLPEPHEEAEVKSVHSIGSIPTWCFVSWWVVQRMICKLLSSCVHFPCITLWEPVPGPHPAGYWAKACCFTTLVGMFTPMQCCLAHWKPALEPTLCTV